MKTNNSNFDLASLFADPRITQFSKLEAVRVAAADARREATRETFARIGRFLKGLLELPRRHAVRTELSMLTDRELADIGLSRSDLSHVFDEGFAAARAPAGREYATRSATA